MNNTIVVTVIIKILTAIVIANMGIFYPYKMGAEEGNCLAAFTCNCRQNCHHYSHRNYHYHCHIKAVISIVIAIVIPSVGVWILIRWRQQQPCNRHCPLLLASNPLKLTSTSSALSSSLFSSTFSYT